MIRNYPQIDIKKTGKRIKTIMQIKGFSVKDVQRFLCLETPQSIYHWLDGRNLPTVDNLYGLSILFDMPIDSIIVGNHNHSKETSMQKRMWAYYLSFRQLLL